MKTTCVLHLCDTSGGHRAIARFSSESPFHAFHVGDRFDDTGWNRLGGVGVVTSPVQPIRYTIHSIKHLVEDSESGLTVRYRLNLAVFTRRPSAVGRNN